MKFMEERCVRIWSSVQSSCLICSEVWLAAPFSLPAIRSPIGTNRRPLIRQASFASKMHAKAGNVQQNCKSPYQACLTPIEPLAEERYRKAVERYDDELDRYRRRTQVRIPGLGTHHTRLGLGWLSRGLGFAVGLGGGPYYGLGYSCPFFYEPPSVRPNRRREFDRLRYQQCEVECGCQRCRMPAF